MLTVSDPDSATVTITDNTGGDGALFTVNANSGQVTANTMNGSFNFETPQDINGDNVYEQVVTLSDGSNSVSETIRVTITDVDEAPEFNNPGVVSLNENATGVIVAFSAVDPEGAAITPFRISQVEKLGEPVNAQRLLDAFEIDPATGALSVVIPFDAEVEGTQDRITVAVETSDGSNVGTGSVSIQLVDLPARVVAGVKYTGRNEIERLGAFTGSVGDLDGDGVSEAWIAETTGLARETAWLVWGSTLRAEMSDGVGDARIDTLANSARLRFLNDDPSTTARQSVMTAVAIGDVDGDTIPDLLVGLQEQRNPRDVADAPDGPVAYVLWGDRLRANTTGSIDLANLATADGIRLQGVSRLESVGLSLASADFDGDGRADIVLGSPQKNRVRLVYGSALARGTASLDIAAASAAQAVLIESITTNNGIQQIGKVVAASNDINGDGRPELLISGAGLEPQLEDGVYVVAGTVLEDAKGVSTQVNLLDNAIADQVIEMLGQDIVITDLSAAGDIDEDGLNDVAIANTGNNFNTQVATVVFGATLADAFSTGSDPSLVFTDAADGVRVFIDGQIESQLFDSRVSTLLAPSIGGGSGSELLIGINEATPSNRECAGAIVVLTDTAIRTASTASIAFTADALPASLGRQLNGIAANSRLGAYLFVDDLDADGRPDLSLASPSAGGTGAYLFLPGTVLDDVFAGASATYDLANALNSETL